MPPFDSDIPPTSRFPLGAPSTTQVSRLMEFGPWTRSAQRRVGVLADLPEGWDGKNALPIQPKAKSNVFGVIDALTKLGIAEPHIVPIANGGLQLEWVDDDRELELEVSPNGDLDFLIVNSDGVILSGEIPGNDDLGVASVVSCWLRDDKKTLGDRDSYATL